MIRGCGQLHHIGVGHVIASYQLLKPLSHASNHSPMQKSAIHICELDRGNEGSYIANVKEYGKETRPFHQRPG